jgi:U3 small nucleolar RNA-associated protein 25
LDDDEEEDEDDWQKPSAYNRLIGILQKTSKHQDFYKRMKLEEEGLEDQENGMATDEDEDDEEPEEQGNV